MDARRNAHQLNKRHNLQASQGSHPSGAETLLVVDDEDVVLDVTCEMLQKLGYTVLRAHSGEEAVAFLSSSAQRIDAVVLDLTMPSMDGEECMKQFRRIDPNLRILVATARLVAVHQHEWFEQGAWDAIQKPFLFEDLAGRIRRMLDASSPAPISVSSPALA